jgi:hypothetical protein
MLLSLQIVTPHDALSGTEKDLSNLIITIFRNVEEAAEKLKFLSFRGTLRAEESLLLLTLELREIPHFVRNDKIPYFFRGPETVIQIFCLSFKFLRD